MREYEALGHMVKVNDESAAGAYYFPHHGVLRESSTTTKLRTVFDGTSTFSSKDCLNKFLYSGPKLQNSIFDILTRFRTHSIVFISDVEKMYRQIKICADDQKYLCIFWRESPLLPLNVFQLTTVTYGTTSAPFQANRCLKQIAIDLNSEFPLAAKIINDDCYVDDFVSGADSLEQALQCKNELISALNAAQFHLRKWMSNSTEFLETIDVKDRYFGGPVELFESKSLGVLGLQWIPDKDVFKFDLKIKEYPKMTKRTILSQIAQLFDPFGWVGPVIVLGKIMMKTLWMLRLNWDQEVNLDIKSSWNKFLGDIHTINSLSIPRFVGELSNFTFHGFCDASETAYGACIYAKIGNKVTLLCSKSRVTPIKRMSIPRLELCAAHLLVRVFRSLFEALKISSDRAVAWTDSSIVLAWLSKPASRWKTFVGNRVEEIHEFLRPSQFFHVRTHENPADILSRGLDASKLKNNTLWWHGPSWLSQFESFDCAQSENFVTELEVRKKKQLCFFYNENLGIMDRFSKLNKLLRVLAYVNRFIGKLKKTTVVYPSYVTAAELKTSLLLLCRSEQIVHFNKDYHKLKLGQPLSRKSKILSLNPFIDSDGVIRLNGRLSQASISFESKYQIVLPYNSHLSRLIVRDAHERGLHANVRLVCGIVRDQFWIIRLKNLVKFIIRKCVLCQKHKKESRNQLMGELPSFRMEENLPFVYVGIDYCGPFQIISKTGRGRKTILKSYCCVFVCLTTKACHLELVGDLSTDAFVATITRFVSRRGLPAHIFSDNGRNFLGAKRRLDELNKFLSKNESQIANSCTPFRIEWHFQPPYTPHMGGMWEACVKSVKYHLVRVIGNTDLTFEELSTILAKIESCLNSRPLIPLTDNVEEIEVLTPGHFLIGRPLLSFPDISHRIEHRPLNNRWVLAQKMIRDFWVKWKNSYLSSLTSRSKWKNKTENFKLGDIVTVKEETSPLSWSLGRIVKLYPGNDNMVRVVDLKTKSGISKRSVNNLIPINVD